MVVGDASEPRPRTESRLHKELRESCKTNIINYNTRSGRHILYFSRYGVLKSGLDQERETTRDGSLKLITENIKILTSFDLRREVLH